MRTFFVVIIIIFISYQSVTAQSFKTDVSDVSSYFKIEWGYSDEKISFDQSILESNETGGSILNLNLIYGQNISKYFRLEGLFRFWDNCGNLYYFSKKISDSPLIEHVYEGEYNSEIISLMIFPQFKIGNKHLFIVGAGLGANTYFKKSIVDGKKKIYGQDDDFIRIQELPDISGTQVAIVYGFNVGYEIRRDWGSVSLNYRMDKNIPILLSNSDELYLNDSLSSYLMGFTIPLTSIN